jgi:hypothetical protein
MATSKHRPHTRPPFDPGREFVALRSLPAGGATLGPGDKFSKTLVTARRLRQLYDARSVGFDPDQVYDVPDVYVARRGVKVNGREFEVGEVFPRDAVPPTRLEQMLSQGSLSHTAPRRRRVARPRLRRAA